LKIVKDYYNIRYSLRRSDAIGRTKPPNPMGRKLEFNDERAVQRATRVFWAKGYSSASMRDLLKAMGIGEGLFYHSFGGKNRLYLECLRHYNETVTRRRLDPLEAEPSVRKGLRNFFRGLIDDLDNPKRPYVCLMARSLSSDVLDETELGASVKAGMKLFHSRPMEFERMGWNFSVAPATRQG
jgi:TetR/AcrR family transcriptional repressor of nem operon